MTNYPLRQVLQKPEASCRILKWVIELRQFDIRYNPQIVIKGHALADFIVEFTRVEETDAHGDLNKDLQKQDLPAWSLYVNRSSNEGEAAIGLTLISLENHHIHCALRFGFEASNNESEYKALIVSLYLARKM